MSLSFLKISEEKPTWPYVAQWHAPGQRVVRFVVEDPDALYDEYADKDVFGPYTKLADTDWGTREFGIWDPDGNTLIFMRDL